MASLAELYLALDEGMLVGPANEDLRLLLCVKRTQAEMVRDRGYALPEAEQLLVRERADLDREAYFEEQRAAEKAYLRKLCEAKEGRALADDAPFKVVLQPTSAKDVPTVRQLFDAVYAPRGFREGRWLAVYYLAYERTAKKDVKAETFSRAVGAAEKAAEGGRVEAALLVPESLLRPEQRALLERRRAKPRIEFFADAELYANPTKHCLVGRFRRLPQKEKYATAFRLFGAPTPPSESEVAAALAQAGTEAERAAVRAGAQAAVASYQEALRNFPLMEVTDMMARYHGWRQGDLIECEQLNFFVKATVPFGKIFRLVVAEKV